MNQLEQFSVHEEPIWRDRANFIINAALPEVGRFEQLWSRQTADHQFEICCIPFFIHDVALGDVVETKVESSRKYVVDHVVKKSGRYVFRVHFGPSMFRHRCVTSEHLAQLGALLEWSSSSLLAVDARDLEHAEELSSYLADQESRERLVYETGKSA